MDDDVSWPPHSNNHFCIWKLLLKPLWVTEALNRPQKDPNMILNGKLSQPYSLLGLFCPNTNNLLTRLDITWVDRHVPSIVLVYGYTFWTLYGSHRPQRVPNMVLDGKFSQPCSQYSVRAQALGIAGIPCGKCR